MTAPDYVRDLLKLYTKLMQSMKKAKVEIPEADPQDPERVRLGLAFLKMHQDRLLLWMIDHRPELFRLKEHEDFRWDPDFQTREEMEENLELLTAFFESK